MSKVVRKYEIRRRRARRNRIKQLRAKLGKTTSPAQVQSIMTKIKKRHPFYPVSELTGQQTRVKKAA